MDFVDIIKEIIDQNVRLSIRFGEVTATFNSPKRLSIKLSGSSTAVTDVRYLDSYAPQVGHIVVCIVNKGNIIVLGNLAS